VNRISLRNKYIVKKEKEKVTSYKMQVGGRPCVYPTNGYLDN